MRNITHKWTRSEHLFLKLGHSSLFIKGQGRPSSSPQSRITWSLRKSSSFLPWQWVVFFHKPVISHNTEISLKSILISIKWHIISINDRWVNWKTRAAGIKDLFTDILLILTFTKQCKQEADGDLNVYVDELRPSIAWIFLGH